MIMWMMRRKRAEELDSILYFLSNALTSVIEDNSHLAHHGAALPRISAGLAAAEIASRLAMFREQVCDVSQREFMVVTKLARARHWARELRRHEPHLRADIDAFLSLTSRCEAMARDCVPDPESLFDGEAQPKRFLAGRVPVGRSAAEAALSLMERLQASEHGEVIPEDGGPRYLIGGELSVEALDEACERLLARLSAHYGWEAGSSEGLGEEPPERLDAEPPQASVATTPDTPEGESNVDTHAIADGETTATNSLVKGDDPFARWDSEPADVAQRGGGSGAAQAR